MTCVWMSTDDRCSLTVGMENRGLGVGEFAIDVARVRARCYDEEKVRVSAVVGRARAIGAANRWAFKMVWGAG